MASIRLVSINIERSKHLDLVSDFLSAQQADVICLQELCERDITYFESSLGMQCIFAPEGLHPADAPEIGGVLVGNGIFCRLPITEQMIEYYAGSEDGARAERIHNTFDNHALIMCDIEKDGRPFRIATLHFTWTPDGQPNDLQRQDMKALLTILDSAGDFVLAGDFNAPRMIDGVPGEIFAKFAQL